MNTGWEREWAEGVKKIIHMLNTLRQYAAYHITKVFFFFL